MSSRSSVAPHRTPAIQPAAGSALALAFALALAGCSDIYSDRRNTVSFAAGDAPASNAIVQMVDPWPPAAINKNIAHNGERMQAAVERYRTNKVTPLQGTSTSSVQYQPLPAQPAQPAASK